MITNTTIPPELENLIIGVHPDFILESSRDKPIFKALLIIGLAIFVAISFIITIIFNEDDFLVILSGILTFFTFFYGIDCLFKEGKIFVSTPDKLISYKKGNIEIRHWYEFTNPFVFKQKGTYGSISLEIKEEYLPQNIRYRSFFYESNIFDYLSDKIFIFDIPNVLKIHDICHQRIIENNLKKDYKNYENYINSKN